MKEHRIEGLNTEILEAFGEKRIVLGDGEVNSRIALIGEAPGKKEVELQKPFVGAAGRYLDEFLEVLDIRKEEVYISNVVKFRPTKENKATGNEVNRPPTEKEIDIFVGFLFKEMSIIKPSLIVTLGNVPLKALSGDKDMKIGEVHGQLLIKKGFNRFNIFPLYHPAAVIYRKALKEVYINDLIVLKDILKNNNI